MKRLKGHRDRTQSRIDSFVLVLSSGSGTCPLDPPYDTPLYTHHYFVDSEQKYGARNYEKLRE